MPNNSIRNLIDGVYDIQALRIATGNRVVAALRPEFLEAQGVDKDAEQKEKDSVLQKILKEYRRVTDAYVEHYQGKGRIEKALSDVSDRTFIKDKVDYALVRNYLQLRDTEDEMVKVVAANVEVHPMWDAFFRDVKGVGPLMAGVCLAYLDPYKARHASSFWRYCGLDVVIDEDRGEMRGNGKWYTEMRPYTTKEGEEAERKSLTYNPFVKTKLVEVLVGSFLKAKGSYYGKIYYDYKNRLEQRELSPVHRHRMAARYCAKMFLRDMWVVWRELEGLPVSDPYEVAKLGHKPHRA